MSKSDKVIIQKEVLKRLKRGESMTQLEALNELECMRLAVPIERLRKAGYNIKTDMITRYNSSGIKKRFARYSLNQNFTFKAGLI